MNAIHSCETLRLSARQTRVLSHAAGAQVHCVAGHVWITQYGDDRDLVLGPGQTMVLDRPTALVMSSAVGAELCLAHTDPAPTRHPGLIQRIAGWFDPRWSSRVAEALGGAGLA